ncbi:hypothetical protein [Sphingomonas sp.]|jgi:hypothetical protein|uniref:hypothetical protein n=1 Tax=Sphingomonas sp. TaxID=28214 RepID=UPI0035641E59
MTRTFVTVTGKRLVHVRFRSECGSATGPLNGCVNLPDGEYELVSAAKAATQSADGWKCENCGQTLPWNSGHACHAPVKPINTGWLCPRCGRGNAPSVRVCDCHGVTHHTAIPATLNPGDTFTIETTFKDRADDGWIEWRGGACPMSVDARVSIRLRDGDESTGKAGRFNWSHRSDELRAGDIVAYKVQP